MDATQLSKSSTIDQFIGAVEQRSLAPEELELWLRLIESGPGISYARKMKCLDLIVANHGQPHSDLSVALNQSITLYHPRAIDRYCEEPVFEPFLKPFAESWLLDHLDWAIANLSLTQFKPIEIALLSRQLDAACVICRVNIDRYRRIKKVLSPVIDSISYAGVKATVLHRRYGREEYLDLIRKVKRSLESFWHRVPDSRVWCDIFTRQNVLYGIDLDVLISLVEPERARDKIVATMVAKELSGRNIFQTA